MQAVFYDAFLSAWAVFIHIMSLFHTEPHRAYRSAFVAVNRSIGEKPAGAFLNLSMIPIPQTSAPNLYAAALI